MKSKRPNKKKLGHPRRVLRLPDLDHAKTVVLNTLLSLDSQRAYRFAMDDFIAWYCSEPGWPSTRPWFCATSYNWNRVTWRPRRSTYD